ncbi:DUF1326 domain-containing protein [Sulfitobacter aestuarii]|uniref:DUF1326 domain-containing protein n=1 Tax=Sulfitobacter aestuarii TaxID=2161676 RepID=A0ABW5U5C8_9RHOB
MTPWEINGREAVNCNCNFGCPCQFGVLPSKGHCEAAVVYEIDSGHHGETRLDGLRAAAVYHWPGAIHEGNGEMQLIVDEGTSEAQRAALEAIMTGQDTEEMATMWFVYAKMCPTKHETLTAPIRVEMDIDRRVGEGSVEGIFDIALQPVPHIVTGEPHRALIKLPNGFEFEEAEMASGRTRLRGGAISFDPLDDSHAHFAHLHLTGQGVQRGHAGAA